LKKTHMKKGVKMMNISAKVASRWNLRTPGRTKKGRLGVESNLEENRGASWEGHIDAEKIRTEGTHLETCRISATCGE